MLVAFFSRPGSSLHNPFSIRFVQHLAFCPNAQTGTDAAVDSDQEMGLLGLEFHTDFSVTHYSIN